MADKAISVSSPGWSTKRTRVSNLAVQFITFLVSEDVTTWRSHLRSNRIRLQAIPTRIFFSEHNFTFSSGLYKCSPPPWKFWVSSWKLSELTIWILCWLGTVIRRPISTEVAACWLPITLLLDFRCRQTHKKSAVNIASDNKNHVCLHFKTSPSEQRLSVFSFALSLV